MFATVTLVFEISFSVLHWPIILALISFSIV